MLIRWIQWNHKGPESGGEEQERWGNKTREYQRGARRPPLKLEKRGCEPWSVGGLGSRKRQGNDQTWRLHKGMEPCLHLTFALLRPVSDF